LDDDSPPEAIRQADGSFSLARKPWAGDCWEEFMKAGDLRMFLRSTLWLAPAIATLSASGAQAIKQGPLLGKPAPAFHIQGIFNEPLSLESFKGHILVMQFGASW
jgi:hypothetical protein